MPGREYTVDEVREQFLDHVRGLTKYWSNVKKETTLEQLEGLAFSILVAIDGCSANLPAFTLAPCPHPSDKPYHQAEGSNWYPESGCDIGGGLHELFYKNR